MVPTGVVVRSGDVIVMHGESRLCYHGVPCILPPSVLMAMAMDGEYREGLGGIEGIGGIEPDKSSTPQLYVEESVESKTSVESKESKESVVERVVAECIIDPVQAYLALGRININVRQVVRKGVDWEEKAGTGAGATLPSPPH